MKKLLLTVTLIACCLTAIAQTNAEKAHAKLGEAIKLMDNGNIDESIAILEECEKLDPKSFIYPYEIAFAYSKKKEYDKTIKILKKTLKYAKLDRFVDWYTNKANYMEVTQKNQFIN
jgi:tetratricopeptide (TPR) repeat protein